MSNRAFTPEQERKARALVISWPGKSISWKAMLEAFKNDLGVTVSKVSIMNTYPKIYEAFIDRKSLGKGVFNINDTLITTDSANTISDLREKLEKCQAERDVYKADYELAQEILQRVIVNANSIPNLHVESLFKEID